ncbi:MAG: glycosyltransferase [Acidimicrobiales bacterium]|nr:glycosyltransferase [Acidimicrobiales bacterium]
MYELASGLKESSDHEVRLFLDKATLPGSLLAEPSLSDADFVDIGPWVTRYSMLRPTASEIAVRLSEFDVALVTELGPVFGPAAGIPFVFIPTGWDLTCGPFPIRSRATRSRGLGDLSALAVAYRMRAGISRASGIWGASFAPFADAAARLGNELTNDLPQPIDTELFAPGLHRVSASEKSDRISIFHPSRIMMSADRFLVETGQCKRNDLLFEGMALAMSSGVDVHLRLIWRDNCPDQDIARRLIEDLGLTENVEWLEAGDPSGFTWRELADLYRESDLVVDEFGGWFGLVALEGAACGRPVLNHVDRLTMSQKYPDGHPFLQASSAAEVCEVLVRLLDERTREEIGDKSRRWVLRHHDRSVVGQRAVENLKGIGIQ